MQASSLQVACVRRGGPGLQLNRQFPATTLSLQQHWIDPSRLITRVYFLWGNNPSFSLPMAPGGSMFLSPIRPLRLPPLFTRERSLASWLLKLQSLLRTGFRDKLHATRLSLRSLSRLRRTGGVGWRVFAQFPIVGRKAGAICWGEPLPADREPRHLKFVNEKLMKVLAHTVRSAYHLWRERGQGGL